MMASDSRIEFINVRHGNVYLQLKQPRLIAHESGIGPEKKTDDAARKKSPLILGLSHRSSGSRVTGVPRPVRPDIYVVYYSVTT